MTLIWYFLALISVFWNPKGIPASDFCNLTPLKCNPTWTYVLMQISLWINAVWPSVLVWYTFWQFVPMRYNKQNKCISESRKIALWYDHHMTVSLSMSTGPITIILRHTGNYLLMYGSHCAMFQWETSYLAINKGEMLCFQLSIHITRKRNNYIWTQTT